MMEKWGAKNGVKIVKVPNSYGVYVEKMTASLTSGSDQYDVIWHNDDWGQLWAHLLEPTDDVAGLKYAEKWGMDGIIFNNAQGQNTVVPMGHTFGVFFYRSDLVKESELPKTFDELVTISKKLQADGKVKFGYVGGMSMNHTWFSWFWSMWGNNCDVLLPVYERANAKLAANGWKSALDRALHAQVGRVLVGRDQHPQDQSARHAGLRPQRGERGVHSGRCRLYRRRFGLLGDVQRSRQIQGRRQDQHRLLPARAESQGAHGLERHLGLGDSEIDPAERKKLAKQMLSDMMLDEDGQIELWKATGAPPPNKSLWEKIAKDDAFMRQLKKVSLDVPVKVRGAYYFEKWPGVHKAFSDAVIKAVTGKREDIPKSARRRRAPWSPRRSEMMAAAAPPRRARRAFGPINEQEGKWPKSYSAKSTSITARPSTR